MISLLLKQFVKFCRESGSTRVLVVNAYNGADEILTTGITKICELKDGQYNKVGI